MFRFCSSANLLRHSFLPSPTRGWSPLAYLGFFSDFFHFFPLLSTPTANSAMSLPSISFDVISVFSCLFSSSFTEASFIFSQLSSRLAATFGRDRSEVLVFL